MAPIFNSIISALGEDAHWGPPPTEEKSASLNDVPYAPYSKGDKLGRMADWTTEAGKDGQPGGRGGRGGYNRYNRDREVYGAGTSALFPQLNAEDESSFSVVDNRSSTKTRTPFSRGGGTVFGRGRGGRGGNAAGAGGRGGRGGSTFNTARGGRGGAGADGGRGGRGGRGRRFGWKDYDKPQRNRDSSVQIKPEWKMLEEIDFNRLAKLNLETDEGEDVETYGQIYYYDRSYDKTSTKPSSKPLVIFDRAWYNPTTSTDPVIQKFAANDEAVVFATDSILSTLMCAPRSVYSWDIVINRIGNKLFFDKRDGSQNDFVSVNENATDPPLEVSEGSKESINSPSRLALEATVINANFALQVVNEDKDNAYKFEHEDPFYAGSAADEELASKGYRYRRFDLSLNDEAPINMIVRTEVEAVMKNPVSGEDNFVTVKALNEFDVNAQGSSGALNWRTKLHSQRGAVVATEMKNNSCKLARWTTQAILAKSDVMKIGFVSRVNPKEPNKHVVLGVVGYKPREFANQMNLSFSNGWGIVRTIVDMCMGMPEGKYVLVKDPNKPVLRLYEVPLSTFEDDADGEPDIEEEDD